MGQLVEWRGSNSDDAGLAPTRVALHNAWLTSSRLHSVSRPFFITPMHVAGGGKGSTSHVRDLKGKEELHAYPICRYSTNPF